MAESTLAQIREGRLEKIKALQKLGIDPYPSKAKKDFPNKEIVENFSKYEGKKVSLTGRIMSWREHGHLIFADIQDKSGKIQLYVKDDVLEKTSKKEQTLGFSDLGLLDVGDFIEATGKITKTQRGEISILPSRIKLLTKAIRPLPEKWHGITDTEERFRRRYLDMTMNPEVRERFVRRSKFWQATRDFLNKNGFVEINIPVLEHVTGGADAKPFVTHYDALDQDFYLRISHELPLKRLLGGGFDKVYDIGPRFRNEGMSDEHLPEHVAMEWYWAYADYREGMKLTEELFKYVLKEVYGTLKFKVKGFEIDLEKKWEEIDFAKIIKEKLGADIFKDSVESMNSVLKKNGIDLGKDVNKNRVVDNLWKIIRKDIAGPVFLTGTPKFLSPLSKSEPENPDTVQRFQLIIGGSEMVNAYSELNDPVDQLDRFVEQQKLREEGDEEAQMLDIDFVEMLEYGMPPAVGYGHSERVFWFFEDVTAKEGVPFPQLKSELEEITKEIYKDLGKYIDLEMKKQRSRTRKQDLDKKVAIILNSKLENWKLLNAVGHISAFIGNKLGQDFSTGANFMTKDGTKYPRDGQHAIVTLSAGKEQLKDLIGKVRKSGLLYHAFTKEMIETNDDTDVARMIEQKEDKDIELLAIGVFGKRSEVDTLTKKFSLIK